jgi:3-oxoacyl-[acyl-carrier protein] reductase
MGLLDGKKAIISGGSRGIGRALCEVFAREGADVAFNYNVSDDRAAATVDRIQSFGRQARSFKVSVTDRPGINKMVRHVISEFGRVDILVNNAAINRGDNFATMTERAWDEVIETNVNGLFNVTKPVFKQMLRQRSGSHPQLKQHRRLARTAHGGPLRDLEGCCHRLYEMSVARGSSLWGDGQCHCRRNLRHRSL